MKDGFYYCKGSDEVSMHMYYSDMKEIESGLFSIIVKGYNGVHVKIGRWDLSAESIRLFFQKVICEVAKEKNLFERKS